MRNHLTRIFEAGCWLLHCLPSIVVQSRAAHSTLQIVVEKSIGQSACCGSMMEDPCHNLGLIVEDCPRPVSVNPEHADWTRRSGHIASDTFRGSWLMRWLRGSDLVVGPS